MNGVGRGEDQEKRNKGALFTRETVGMTLLLFSAIIFFIAVTGELIFGEIGVAITGFFVGVFGYYVYPLLVLSMYYSAVLVFGKRWIPALWILRVYLLLVAVFLIVHTATAEPYYGQGYGAYLEGCWSAVISSGSVAAGTGGGVLFGLVVYPVRAALSPAGAYVVFALLTALALYFLLLGTPLKRVILPSARMRTEKTDKKVRRGGPEAEAPQPEIQRNERGQIRHQHPKLGFSQLAGETLAELRKIAKDTGVTSITTRRKDDLINDILKTQAEALGYRYNGGTLECMPEGYGFLRPSGLLPSSNDIYVSASQIRRFGLRNGDVVWGIIRPPKDQEHYEALLRVENVNFTDPEEARRRPHFEALTPIFPNEKLQLETDRRQIATRIVDIFAPIGKGQRALIVSPPKAGKTTLLKSLAHSITTNHPEVILMVLLIDERPEEVTDMARSVDGEIIASTFDRPAEEHLRVAGLALEKAKRLVEVSKDVVLLLDSITRLARASNLVVPPSGRTLSGGMDPAALYFPKKFFGAARNIENGGSLTIIGTSLVETGSRMDDVIYEEFKGTGNMEVHLSRKIAEQRIFPALDITKSGTRKEELMVPEADLQRIWALRRKIANMDEAEVLNLILDKLRNTPTNRDFLATIKVG